MKKQTLHVLIFLSIMIFTCFSVRAEESGSYPDPNASYPLTVTYTYTDLSESAAVDGAEITVVQVAEVSVSDQELKYVPLFDENISFPDMTAEESEAAAKRLAEKTRTVSSGFKAVTKEDGSAVFHDLKPGIYLVTETGKKGTAASYETFRPFLIPVPGYETDQRGHVFCREVKAFEKAESKKETAVITSQQPQQDSTAILNREVNTGDEIHAGLWYFLLQCSIAGILWSFIMLKWKAKENTQ
jgi:hypothetical protein